MDLSSSSYSETLGQGARMELVHLGTGKSMSQHGGNDLFVTVLGLDCPSMEESKRTISRRILQDPDAKEKSSETFEIEMACAAVTDFEGGTGTVVTLADFRAFLRSHPDGKHYARRILKFAEQPVNFFKSPPRG